MSFDQSVFQAINGLAHQSRVLDLLGIFLAEYLGHFLILGALILLFTGEKGKKFYFFSFAALSILLSRGLLTEIIRLFYSRPRPFAVLGIDPLINHSATAAFPSGHAAIFFALAFSIWYLAGRRWGLWFSGLALLMGLARVFAGVHWPTDILGGMLVGLLSVIAVKFLLVRK